MILPDWSGHKAVPKRVGSFFSLGFGLKRKRMIAARKLSNLISIFSIGTVFKKMDIAPYATIVVKPFSLSDLTKHPSKTET